MCSRNLTSSGRPENNDEATYAFTIQDTGIGMHKSYIEKIFEPFSIDDSEDRKYRLGTGLGMSIVKNNVDKLGGTISVDSTLGLGSTFTVMFTLKLTDLDVVCEAVKERVNKNSADVSGMKVLLVEDNELNIEVALMLLEDAGVSADVAKNGKEAVDKTGTSSIDDNLGEAEYVGNQNVGLNTQSNQELYFSNARADREVARNDAIAELDQISSNVKASDEEISAAVKQRMMIASFMESEANIETLIKAKGFADCVAVINEDNVNIVVASDALSQSEMLQIQDIVISQYEITLDKIKVINVE